MSAIWGPLHISALFTSGYNSVGSGVWDYRLSQMCCTAMAPPPALGPGWGGRVLSFAYCLPFVYRFTRRRSAGGRTAAGGRQVCFRLVFFAPLVVSLVLFPSCTVSRLYLVRILRAHKSINKIVVAIAFINKHELLND